MNWIFSIIHWPIWKFSNLNKNKKDTKLHKYHREVRQKQQRWLKIIGRLNLDKCFFRSKKRSKWVEWRRERTKTRATRSFQDLGRSVFGDILTIERLCFASSDRAHSMAYHMLLLLRTLNGVSFGILHLLFAFALSLFKSFCSFDDIELIRRRLILM